MGRTNRSYSEYRDRIDVNASTRNTDLNSAIDLKGLDDVTLEALEKLLLGDLIPIE